MDWEKVKIVDRRIIPQSQTDRMSVTAGYCAMFFHESSPWVGGHLESRLNLPLSLPLAPVWKAV